MKTFNRICLENLEFTDGDKRLKLVRGKEYITTPEKDGEVTVFTSPFWVHGVPVTAFAGEKVFTP